MTNEEPPKSDKLRLVTDNDSAKITERQKKFALDDARDQAATSLAVLVANLLRVLAGAGQPHSVPSDLITAFEHYRDAYNAGNRSQIPGLEELVLYNIFREGEERDKPQTEDEWRRWAADNPRRDYEEERRSLLHQLRCHVLREIASKITGSNLQIRREEREIDNLLQQIEETRKQYLNGPRNSASRHRQSTAEREIVKIGGADFESQYISKREITKVRHSKPILNFKQEIADLEIEVLRVRKQDEMIASLQQHQWAALHAVHSDEIEAFRAINAFTFDVLARMQLLERKPGRGKSKRDWQLTQLGTLALSRGPSFVLDPPRR